MEFKTTYVIHRDEFEMYHKDGGYRAYIVERLHREVTALFFKKYEKDHQVRSKSLKNGTGMIELSMTGFDYKVLYEQEIDRRQLLERQIDELRRG